MAATGRTVILIGTRAGGRWQRIGATNERIRLAVAVGDRPGPKTASRREVFLFAAVLAATALTGAAAIAGLKRSVPAAPTVPQIGQTITPTAPAQPERVEPGG
jgi:hypothetical protein